jgi:GNAT superfamily N-acetyltransferase
VTLVIRPLNEGDLPEADRIFRCAFGTQLRLPNPTVAFGDADYVFGRWHANPGNAYAAELDGRLVGSNFATHWDTVGFFGPLTVDPAAWGNGIGKRLIAAAIEQFDKWQLTHRGLFTFPESEAYFLVPQFWVLAEVPYWNHEPLGF